MKLRATLTCVYEFEVMDNHFAQIVCDDYEKAFMDDHGPMLVAGNTTVNVELVYD